jgi:hypothetical protein
MLALVAPLVESDLRALLLDIVGATDASEAALGMCGARVSEQFAVRLYDLCEGPAEQVFLAAPYVTLPGELAKCSLAATLVVPLAWQTWGSRCFKVSQHINILEARGVLEYVRWLINRGVCNHRCIAIVDSGVVNGCTTHTEFFLRQIAGLRLAFGVYLEILWVPTWANPGDAPSQNKQVSDWRREAIPRIFHTRRLLQESAATCEELALLDQHRSENAKFEEQSNTKFSPFTKRKFEKVKSVRRVVSQKSRRHRGKGCRLRLDFLWNMWCQLGL